VHPGICRSQQEACLLEFLVQRLAGAQGFRAHLAHLLLDLGKINRHIDPLYRTFV
jgi:hypothetical protein